MNGTTAAGAGGARPRLTPLRNLLPYVLRYRAKVIAALFFLALAAATTLALLAAFPARGARRIP